MKAKVRDKKTKPQQLINQRIGFASLDPDDLIPRRRASQILGVCPRTVYRHERAKELKPYRRHARATMYRLGDVLKLRDSWAAVPQFNPPCSK